MNGQTNNRCMWEGIPGKEKAYCHLFNADCAICPFNPRYPDFPLVTKLWKVGAEGKGQAIPTQYLLSREHLWVTPAAGGYVLVGVDSFLAGSLYHVRSIVQPALRSHISVGKSCVWVIDLLGTISLRAPISGTVIACNHELIIHPSWVKENPYGYGWLFEVEPAGNWRSELMDAEKGRAFISRSQNMFKDKMVGAATGVADSPRSIDQLAADGGILHLKEIMESNSLAYLQTLLETLEESRQCRLRP
jgi:glycine cleavage system H protein